MIFDAIDQEVRKYVERNDNDKLLKLAGKMKDMDSYLKRIQQPSDFVSVFGKEKAAELMVFHIATNGTMRARMNTIIASLQKVSKDDIF